MATFRNIVCSSNGTAGTVVWPSGVLTIPAATISGISITGASGATIAFSAGAGITAGTDADLTLGANLVAVLSGTVNITGSGEGTLTTNISITKTLTLVAADNYTLTATASGNVVVAGGALGTPTSGTLTNCNGLPQAGVVGLTTADSPQFTAVNIGHATDTTVTRVGAGDIAVEGNAIYRAGGTDVAIADGGTGASTAATARTNLDAQRRVVVLDQDVTCAASSTAVVNVNMAGTTADGLTVFGFPVAANEAVSFEIIFRTTDTANPNNQRYGINVPSGAAGHASLSAVTIGGTAIYAFGGATDGTGTMVNVVATSSGGSTIHMRGSLLNGGTPGNVVLMFGQSSSSGTTFTIKKGALFLISNN